MFEPNQDAKFIAFKDIKGRSAIIVDDFYENPDEIRELALSIKYSDQEGLTGGFPGMRGSLENFEVKEKLYNLYLDLCSNDKLWKIKKQKTQLLEDGSFKIPLDKKNRPFNLDDFNSNWDKQGFMVNCTNDSFLKKNPMGIIPHQDYWENEPSENQELQFGSVIFLNTPDECAGGTNLYSYNGEMSISSDWKPEWLSKNSDTYDIRGPVLTAMPDHYKFKYIKDRVNGNDPYTCEFEADMVYNRMFLYQSDVLHSADVDLGMFTNYNRMNQIFFL